MNVNWLCGIKLSLGISVDLKHHAVQGSTSIWIWLLSENGGVADILIYEKCHGVMGTSKCVADP